jgi:hypothetical protein
VTRETRWQYADDMRFALVLVVVVASSTAYAEDATSSPGESPALAPAPPPPAPAPVRQPVVKQLLLGTVTTFVGALPGGLWLIDCSEKSSSDCNKYPPLIVMTVGALAGASVPVWWIGRDERENSSLPITIAGSVAGLGFGSLIAWRTMESTPFVAVTSLLLFPPVGATIGFALSRSPKSTVVPIATANSIGIAGTF